jgi:hypothetical protein
MKIRYVRQEERAGCVVACAAMVTGESYREVAASFGSNLVDDGVNMDHARDYVCDRGFAAVEATAHGYMDVRASNRRMLRPFADVHIVRVLPKVDSTIGHALLMDRRGKLYDPETPGPVDATKYYSVTHVFGFFDERMKGRGPRR